MGGPSLFHTNVGGRSMTHDPRTLPRDAAKLSGVVASIRTTGPRTGRPPVPGAQAQLAAVRACGRGAISRAHIGPRVQVPPNRHASRGASRPEARKPSTVPSFAAL